LPEETEGNVADIHAEIDWNASLCTENASGMVRSEDGSEDEDVDVELEDDADEAATEKEEEQEEESEEDDDCERRRRMDGASASFASKEEVAAAQTRFDISTPSTCTWRE
jgi:hypothetical protein